MPTCSPSTSERDNASQTRDDFSHAIASLSLSLSIVFRFEYNSMGERVAVQIPLSPIDAFAVRSQQIQPQHRFQQSPEQQNSQHGHRTCVSDTIQGQLADGISRRLGHDTLRTNIGSGQNKEVSRSEPSSSFCTVDTEYTDHGQGQDEVWRVE